MSPEPLDLAAYIRALVAGVAAAEPDSALRLRQIVGDAAALITVDAETVRVRFIGERLEVTPGNPDDPADGFGATDRAAVLDLLAGRIELTAAILNDRLRLVGPSESVVRIARAIDILLDVSVRAPALQALAERYRRESSAPVSSAPPPSLRESHRRARQSELQLLGRLGLLNGE